MLSNLCAALPALYTLFITMAQVAGQEEREKSTALKGEYVTALWETYECVSAFL